MASRLTPSPLANEAQPLWSLDEFIPLVAKLRPPPVVALAKASAQAMVRESMHAAFHARRVRELHSDIDTSGHSDPGRAVMKLIAHAAEGLDGGFAFAKTEFAIGAHFMAYVRCLHAAFDLSASVMYHALDLASLTAGSMKVTDVYLSRVREALVGAHIHQKLRSAIADLLAHEDFVYIKDLSNASKHRTLIRTPYTVALRFDGSASPHGLRVAAFSFDNRTHRAMDGLEVAGRVHVESMAALIAMMRSLNAALHEPAGA
jgi:hypothetical protein